MSEIYVLNDAYYPQQWNVIVTSNIGPEPLWIDSSKTSTYQLYVLVKGHLYVQYFRANG